MSELQDNLNEILRQKNTYLLSENLKKDVTLLGITGSYEGELPNLTKYEYFDMYSYTGTYDTGVKGGNDTEVIIKFKSLKNLWSTSSVRLFGARTDNKDTSTVQNCFTLTTYKNGNFNYNNTDYILPNSIVDKSSPIQLKLNNTGVYQYNTSTEQYDTLLTIADSTIFTTDANMYLIRG